MKYSQFSQFKSREGFERIFPYDIEESLEKELLALGLTEENFEKAKATEASLSFKVQSKVADIKEKARKAGVLADSIESLAYSDAKVDELDTALSRLQELETYTKDLIVPWTRSQLMKSLPWMLVALLTIAFGITTLISRPNSQQSPAETEIKK